MCRVNRVAILCSRSARLQDATCPTFVCLLALALQDNKALCTTVARCLPPSGAGYARLQGAISLTLHGLPPSGAGYARLQDVISLTLHGFPLSGAGYVRLQGAISLTLATFWCRICQITRCY